MGSGSFHFSNWVVGTAALALGACSGSKFTAGASSTAGGNAGDAMVSGGDGGSSGGAGDANGGTGAAGTGGKPTTTCDCAAGNYCQDGTNKCRSCADFSRLQFATPQKLTTLSQTQGGNERFPRAASAGSDLFYRSGAVDAERLWYAATPVSGIGRALTAAGLAVSAPLLAAIPADTLMGTLGQNFFFDRVDTSTGLRHLMMANWSGVAITDVIMAPAPLNDVGADFSIAVAATVGPEAGADAGANVSRAYWMSTRTGNAAADLVWSRMVGGAMADPIVLGLEVQAGANQCPRLGDDATPWVNAAGTLLLFRSESVDDACQPNDSDAFDLYAVPLSKDTGLPTTAGVALSALNTTGGASTETDPSLSPDSCLIYFASDNGTMNFDLYRAARN